MSMSFSTLQFCVILLSLTAVLCNGTQVNLAQVGECSSRNGNGTEVGEVNDLVPLIDDEKVEKMRIVMNETRRRLGSFQICAPCTCCGARGPNPSESLAVWPGHQYGKVVPLSDGHLVSSVRLSSCNVS
ncbi:hypothetical protein AKJ16_DCAP21554 [Drosera capensis]